jgi:putative hemolysin
MDLSLLALITIFIILLLILFCLTAVYIACRHLEKKDSKKPFHFAGKLFFYQYLSRLFFLSYEYEDIYFISLISQGLIRFAYVIWSIYALTQLQLVTFNDYSLTQLPGLVINWPLGFLALTSSFITLFIIGDYFPRILGARYPDYVLKICGFLASCVMSIVFFITLPFLKLFYTLFPSLHFDRPIEPAQEAKQELIDMIEESDFDSHLDPHDKKLIESVMGFSDRIVREVMVPRVDIFSLSHDTTIEKAAQLLYSEGYSRIPIYKTTLDNIIGVLMYKDVLAKFMESVNKNQKNILQAPIASLVKSVIYTPETKKISHLLQEFRKKQVHLAIIVDEYGGTEGIVTIEDILEEIVGDISDEYDEEEALFVALPEGGWLIDARMSITDIEEQLGIEIAQEGDYDTIGGYVFHETGTIPDKGYVISKPHFELEVIRSNNRHVEKLKIKSLFASDENQSLKITEN